MSETKQVMSTDFYLFMQAALERVYVSGEQQQLLFDLIEAAQTHVLSEHSYLDNNMDMTEWEKQGWKEEGNPECSMQQGQDYAGDNDMPYDGWEKYHVGEE